MTHSDSFQLRHQHQLQQRQRRRDDGQKASRDGQQSAFHLESFSSISSYSSLYSCSSGSSTLLGSSTSLPPLPRPPDRVQLTAPTPTPTPLTLDLQVSLPAAFHLNAHTSTSSYHLKNSSEEEEEEEETERSEKPPRPPRSPKRQPPTTLNPTSTRNRTFVHRVRSFDDDHDQGNTKRLQRSTTRSRADSRLSEEGLKRLRTDLARFRRSLLVSSPPLASRLLDLEENQVEEEPSVNIVVGAAVGIAVEVGVEKGVEDPFLTPTVPIFDNSGAGFLDKEGAARDSERRGEELLACSLLIDALIDKSLPPYPRQRLLTKTTTARGQSGSHSRSRTASPTSSSRYISLPRSPQLHPHPTLTCSPQPRFPSEMSRTGTTTLEIQEDSPGRGRSCSSGTFGQPLEATSSSPRTRTSEDHAAPAPTTPGLFPFMSESPISPMSLVPPLPPLTNVSPTPSRNPHTPTQIALVPPRLHITHPSISSHLDDEASSHTSAIEIETRGDPIGMTRMRYALTNSPTEPGPSEIVIAGDDAAGRGSNPDGGEVTGATSQVAGGGLKKKRKERRGVVIAGQFMRESESEVVPFDLA